MRFAGQLLFLSLAMLGLQGSVNAQVQMKLGGPATYGSVPAPSSSFGEHAPNRVLPQVSAAGVSARFTSYQDDPFGSELKLPSGNTQIPTLLPTLNEAPPRSEPPRLESAPSIGGEYLPEIVQPKEAPAYTDPVQAGEIDFPDPVTIANPTPTPTGNSVFEPITRAPQVQAPPVVNSQPVYESMPSLPSSAPVEVYQNYQLLPDPHSTGGASGTLTDAVATNTGLGCDSGCDAGCGCESGWTAGRRGLLGRSSRGRILNRSRFSGQRAARGGISGRRVSRRERRASRSQNGLGGPAYMFVDFGGYFGDGTASLSSNDSLSFDQDDNLLFGAGFGRYLTRDFRIDLSARYRFAEIEEDSLFDSLAGNSVELDGGTEFFTTMLTGRYSMPGNSCIKPYLSAGIGFAYGRSHGTSISSGGPAGLSAVNTEGFRSSESTSLAYALGGGVAFKMTERMYFDLDYQYTEFGTDRETGTSASGDRILFDDVNGNEVAFRLRFNF